jgi:hypothetical protein
MCGTRDQREIRSPRFLDSFVMDWKEIAVVIAALTFVLCVPWLVF